jgi:hypothetical protein
MFEVYLWEEPKGKGIIPIQVGDLVGRHWVTCKSARYDRCIGYMSVTVFVLTLSCDSRFSGFGCFVVVFFS